MSQNYLLFLLPGILFVWSCNQTASVEEARLSEQDLTQVEDIPRLSSGEGLKMLKLHCYACHNPKSASHDDILAPPLAGVKFRYQKSFPERADFIQQMTAFVYNPTREDALMKGPVRRFGPMPKTNLKEEEIKALTAFIFDNKMEAPSWFAKHFEEEHGREWKE